MTSHHHTYYPSQIVLLTAAGKVLGEYWHSGYLERLLVADVDRDGKEEILLGGVSNAYRAATLVVLEPDTITGASVEPTDRFQLTGFPHAQERLRAIFPRSCIANALDLKGGVVELSVDQAGIFVATAAGAGYCETTCRFNERLEFESCEVTDDFRAAHATMRAAGQLDHDLSLQESRELAHVRVIRH